MRTTIATVLLALVLALAGTTPINAEERSFDGTYDIDALLKQAGKTLDLETEDAVILFRRVEIYWTADHRLVESTHQAILIRTEYGIDHFADLRIPWDRARQRLTEGALRTYRLSDDQWISAGATAVVETLPYAVDSAPDYCHLRETMLLHDGVELPCVLETAWTVEDSKPFRAGASGTHSLMGPEPALVSRIDLVVPAGSPLAFHAAGGAPQPILSERNGLQYRTFEMNSLGARLHPVTDESIRQQPRVDWSTWESWDTLATDITGQIDKQAVLDDDLRLALEKELEKARTPGERARKTAEFVDRTTRLIHVDPNWWPDPRPASRTWATGYGHRLDRAVLAAALFREAGFTVSPAWRSAGYGDAVPGVPTLDWSDGIILLVIGENVNGWFDPAGAGFFENSHYHVGRTVWYPAQGREPLHQFAESDDWISLHLDLAFDAEKQAWIGSGVLRTQGSNTLCDRMAGLQEEGLAALNGYVGTLLPGAKVNTWNPEQFSRWITTAGFSLELPAGDRDGQGRLMVELAAPPAIPHVRLHQEKRESDVYLPAPVELACELHLEPGDLETIHVPPAEALENDAGRWQLESSADDEKVVLTRRLILPAAHFPAARWPELRALLLAADQRSGRIVIFK